MGTQGFMAATWASVPSSLGAKGCGAGRDGQILHCSVQPLLLDVQGRWLLPDDTGVPTAVLPTYTPRAGELCKVLEVMTGGSIYSIC